MLEYLRWLFNKHMKVLLGMIILLVLTFVLNMLNTVYSYSTFATKQLKDYVYEFELTDMEYLCRLVDCDEVFVINKNTGKMVERYVNAENILRPVDITKVSLAQLTGELYYNKLGIAIRLVSTTNSDLEIFFKLTFKNYLVNLFYMYAGISMLVFFVLLVALRRVFEKERLELLIRLSDSEALLNSKSISLMTEHAHHEMNTPLEVVENKVEKIHRVINNHIILEDLETNEDGVSELRAKLNHKMISLEKDFEFIRLSIEQIYEVLGRMRKFKQIRRNGGVKNLKISMEDAFGMVAISNTHFNYNLDDRLKNFDLDSLSLGDGGLRSIIINHLKNSLEACATDISIVFISLRGRYLTFNIEDNGNGIPEGIIDKIFEPDYSTKEKGDSIIRGNGMYLNKHIVNSIGGDIKILKTSILGTVVSISIPVKKLLT